MPSGGYTGSIKQRPNGKWRARYRDADGKEHARHFNRKMDGEKWLREVSASFVRGDYIDPSSASITVSDWCDKWLEGYKVHKPSTYGQGKTHVNRIKAHFGQRKLQSVKPSDVREWVASMLEEGLEKSTVHALHVRFSSIMGAAHYDGLIVRNPCSRRTSPGKGSRRPYVATTEQIWAIYDAMPGLYRNAVLLGAFAGLRIAEAVALRPQDVDREKRTITPHQQWPHQGLKTEHSQWPIPVPEGLITALFDSVADIRDPEVFTLTLIGRPAAPYQTRQHFTEACKQVPGLPEGFRFHDLRHYFASHLIGAGLDIMTVQRAMRHKSPTTTLAVYAHLLPDRDETTRSAIADLFTVGADRLRTDGVL